MTPIFTSNNSRPRFRGRLCPTSKGAPVSGGAPARSTEHGPAHAPALPRVTVNGGLVGGKRFFAARPSFTPPAVLHPTSKGFPYKFVGLIFIVLRSYVMLNTTARAKRARPNVVIASEMLVGTEMLENDTRGK